MRTATERAWAGNETDRAETEARVDLAAAFRLAVRHDLHEGVCNHFSVVLAGGRFLLNRYGLHWSEITASSLLTLDLSGRVLAGEGTYETTAFHIHSRIHLAHPGAVCVLHTHMPFTTTLTITERERMRQEEVVAASAHFAALRRILDREEPDYAG